MPNNFRYLGFIALLFPDAKVIHCVKNPMDACFSCYRRYFNHGQNFSYDLSELVRYYKAYSNLMAHWEKVLPLDIHRLSYEALVRDQRGTLQELMAFCELDWEDSCLEFHKSTRVIHTASRYQVRQPLYQSAIDAWTVFEKELKPLQEMLGELPEISVSV